MTKAEAERLKVKVRNLRWEERMQFHGDYQDGWCDFREKIIALIDRETDDG